MVMEHQVWTEKYRPSKFSEIKGQHDIIKHIKAFVEQKNMPHLMFAGPAGVGKTTTALVIAKELFGSGWRENLLELNASDERGIDIIRHKVKDFARTRAIGNVPFKIIYLDEADALTKEAQQALRRTMENYTQTCRFILAVNYSSKIIEPIQSRCAIFRFKPLPEKDIKSIIEHISKKEGLKVSDDAIEALYEVSEGDCRKAENILQSCSVISKKIDPDLVYEIASVAKPKEVKDILETALKGDFIKSRNKLLNVMLNYGLSGMDIIKQIQKEILNLDTDDIKKLELVAACGETEFRMTEGSDEYLQIESLLSKVALAGEGTLKHKEHKK